jgi:hypothetical protein
MIPIYARHWPQVLASYKMRPDPALVVGGTPDHYTNRGLISMALPSEATEQ